MKSLGRILMTTDLAISLSIPLYSPPAYTQMTGSTTYGSNSQKGQQ